MVTSELCPIRAQTSSLSVVSVAITHISSVNTCEEVVGWWWRSGGGGGVDDGCGGDGGGGCDCGG